jgi:hypothetical protein
VVAQVNLDGEYVAINVAIAAFACLATVLLVRYDRAHRNYRESLRRDERSHDQVERMERDTAPRERVDSDSRPLRVPVSSGARHGGDTSDY